MLKYVGQHQDMVVMADSSRGGSSLDHYVISTRIVVTDTDVQHSGSYKCEPGAAPVASVNVHVLDGMKKVHSFLYFVNAGAASYQ